MAAQHLALKRVKRVGYLHSTLIGQFSYRMFKCATYQDISIIHPWFSDLDHWQIGHKSTHLKLLCMWSRAEEADSLGVGMQDQRAEGLLSFQLLAAALLCDSFWVLQSLNPSRLISLEVACLRGDKPLALKKYTSFALWNCGWSCVSPLHT